MDILQKLNDKALAAKEKEVAAKSFKFDSVKLFKTAGDGINKVISNTIKEMSNALHAFAKSVDAKELGKIEVQTETSGYFYNINVGLVIDITNSRKITNMNDFIKLAKDSFKDHGRLSAIRMEVTPLNNPRGRVDIMLSFDIKLIEQR